MCPACSEDRHGDCVGTIECTCYAYGDAHQKFAASVATPHRDFDEHDEAKDLGDGGLGSGDWLGEERQ